MNEAEKQKIIELIKERFDIDGIAKELKNSTLEWCEDRFSGRIMICSYYFIEDISDIIAAEFYKNESSENIETIRDEIIQDIVEIFGEIIPCDHWQYCYFEDGILFAEIAFNTQLEALQAGFR